MANAREVKGRIRSVKNIAQITRALEAVSASRVRRAQERVSASRHYAEKAWEILLNIQNATQGTVPHPLLNEREEVNNVLMVVITSDRGLAGAYNSNVLRVAQRFDEKSGLPIQYIAVGRKGRDTLFHSGKNVIAEFSDIPAEPTIADISPIAQLAVDAFLKGDVDEVLIAYTDFINMLTQRPVVLPWLPLTPHSEAEQVAEEYLKEVPSVSEQATDYEYEPSAAAVVDEIVPRFTELQLYQAILEAQASEHAARMNAMHSATDNASQLVDDLTLEYNKARQASITNEILDIVGGANALETSSTSEKKTSTERAKPRVQPSKPSEKRNGATLAAMTTAVADATATDDLTVIEGIGPAMSAALTQAGFGTYAKVAQATEEQLRDAIQAAGMRLAPALATWPRQAQYALDGDWDSLKTYQDTF